VDCRDISRRAPSNEARTPAPRTPAQIARGCAICTDETSLAPPTSKAAEAQAALDGKTTLPVIPPQSCEALIAGFTSMYRLFAAEMPRFDAMEAKLQGNPSLEDKRAAVKEAQDVSDLGHTMLDLTHEAVGRNCHSAGGLDLSKGERGIRVVDWSLAKMKEMLAKDEATLK
jgi:hypothetical protein